MNIKDLVSGMLNRADCNNQPEVAAALRLIRDPLHKLLDEHDALKGELLVARASAERLEREREKAVFELCCLKTAAAIGDAP